MGKFLNTLSYSPNRKEDGAWNGRDYRLTEPLSYEADDGVTYTAPKGFVTDGASIPRVFWRIYLPYGKYIEAAVLHDYFYRTETIDISRRKADLLMKEMMKASNVNIIDRNIIYRAVNLFGWSAFKKRKK